MGSKGDADGFDVDFGDLLGDDNESVPEAAMRRALGSLSTRPIRRTRASSP